ncbi:MAG: L-seryl-tRNA(Sec) selenium transferase [Acidobacteria bacterium]|nr:L-seryl-tRNA(Sec) selenium transferase [Acidobacteriota bacterium]
MNSTSPALLRNLPSVDELLRSPEALELTRREGHEAVTVAARVVLARLRKDVQEGRLDARGLEVVLASAGGAIAAEVDRSLQYSLCSVINATGVILHTNLGRAPLTPAAVEHIAGTATRYSNLEFEISAGERGRRDSHLQKLFHRIFSDRDSSTIVVNNNAAAVLLALNSLAEGGEVIVSRGELVEIGESFRIPEVMAKSGAALREVGATNRTRIEDYERAVNQRTRLLLRVHRSNFQMVGFTSQPSLRELVELGHRLSLPVMEDLGSGALFDLRQLKLQGEPGVADSLGAGADIVTYSGDKLLGGPQAGLITGRPELVAAIRRNPLFRALRVDKLTCAALEATLMAYVRKDYAAIPALRMMLAPAAELRERALAIARSVQGGKGSRAQIEVIAVEAIIGGGAAPQATVPSFALACSAAGLSADELASRLRRSEFRVIARVEDGRVILDLRTVFSEQDEQLAAAIVAAVQG